MERTVANTREILANLFEAKLDARTNLMRADTGTELAAEAAGEVQLAEQQLEAAIGEAYSTHGERVAPYIVAQAREQALMGHPSLLSKDFPTHVLLDPCNNGARTCWVSFMPRPDDTVWVEQCEVSDDHQSNASHSMTRRDARSWWRSLRAAGWTLRA